MFLPGDAVGCAVAGQKVPDGYRHLDRMIEGAARHGAEAGYCATCMDARPHDCQRTDPGGRPQSSATVIGAEPGNMYYAVELNTSTVESA